MGYTLFYVILDAGELAHLGFGDYTWPYQTLSSEWCLCPTYGVDEVDGMTKIKNVDRCAADNGKYWCHPDGTCHSEPKNCGDDT